MLNNHNKLKPQDIPGQNVRNVFMLLAATIGIIFMILFIMTAVAPIKVQGQTTINISIHCAGTTAKGQPCKSTVKAPATHCRWHDTKAARCGRPTKGNKPCKQILTKGQTTCRYHNKSQPFAFGL